MYILVYGTSDPELHVYIRTWNTCVHQNLKYLSTSETEFHGYIRTWNTCVHQNLKFMHVYMWSDCICASHLLNLCISDFTLYVYIRPLFTSVTRILNYMCTSEPEIHVHIRSWITGVHQNLKYLCTSDPT